MDMFTLQNNDTSLTTCVSTKDIPKVVELLFGGRIIGLEVIMEAVIKANKD